MIKIQEVTFNYQGKEDNGVESINLHIKEGECILLCGRSGCGKTTVTRLINGLIPYFYNGEQKGEVIAAGMKISNTPMYVISEKIGSVFQNPRAQFFNIDTNSEIAFGIENLSYTHHELEESVKKTVEDLKIQKLIGRSIFELSGGEKQKIAFASIYSMSPEIYILDEPSSNLDVDAIEELRKNIKMLKNQGKTIIVSEHRLYYLKDIADRIVYMDKGRIEKIYKQKDFLLVSKIEREKMGLREIELTSVQFKEQEILNKPYELEINNLILKYKKHTIMSKVDLKASGGEIIGIIGHNGAGKSTFLKALCGLHRDYEGTFKWNGKEINNKERLKLSYMVMQDVNYQLFAESVEKECYFGIKNPDKNIVEEAMNALGIYEYRNRHPNTLSGGEKQRTAVAVSIVCKKEILIFDEPTSGLDFETMLQVSKMLKDLASMGKIIFVVTHDYEFISSSCSRIIHFHKGKIKDDFPVDQKNIEKLKKYFII